MLHERMMERGTAKFVSSYQKKMPIILKHLLSGFSHSLACTESCRKASHIYLEGDSKVHLLHDQQYQVISCTAYTVLKKRLKAMLSMKLT